MNQKRRSGPEGAGLTLLFLVGFLLNGCVSTQDTSSLRRGVYGVEQDVNELNLRVQRLEQTMGKDSGRGSLAELNARMDELRVQVGRLNGRLDEQEHRLEEIQQRRKASTTSDEARTDGGISAEASASPPAEVKASPNIEIPREERPDRITRVEPPPPPPPLPPPPEVPKGVPPIQPPPSQNPEKAAFDQAFDLFQKNQFGTARQQFQAFLKQYPQSTMADSALYWVGECYFSEKQYQNSIETFQQVLNRYPSGNKTPNAMLKQAAAFQQIGDKTAARILYERLIDKYPRSPQAQIAKQKLKQMQ
ncbi:MAG TPA: tol-pal system protein YbgF [Syntrophobacteraceae bacterium]|nr:tol-pal system protein YbgF [Syntrophobacteraceae bacterium]HBZ53772.1 tol-pal system protein YbgF [Syntrophobacteraceae bacterium]